MTIACSLGSKLPEVVRIEIGPVGDQPIRVPQVAATNVVGWPRADRLPFVVPCPDFLEELPHRAVSMLEEPQFLGHLGQVGREGQSTRRRLVVKPAGRTVGRVGTQADPGTRGDLGFRSDRAQPFPGRGVGHQTPIAMQTDHLGEYDRTQWCLGDRFPAQSRGRRIGQECRPRIDRGPHVPGRIEGHRCFIDAATIRDHPPQPG